MLLVPKRGTARGSASEAKSPRRAGRRRARQVKINVADCHYEVGRPSSICLRDVTGATLSNAFLNDAVLPFTHHLSPGVS